MAGHAPTVAHIEEMAARFGQPFVAALFVEAFILHDQRIAELEALLQRDAAHRAGMLAGVLCSSRRDSPGWREPVHVLRPLLTELDPLAYPPPAPVVAPPVRRSWLTRLLYWAA